jgi:hypothetical protein
MPSFATEAEEANWWYEQRHNIAAEFERVKPKPGPSGSLMALARKRGITFEELQAQLRAHASESEEATALPRST